MIIMDMIETLKNEDIPFDVTEIAVKMHEICCNKTVTFDHLVNKGLFTNELYEEFEKMDYNPVLITEARKVFDNWYEFKLRLEMDGLGGM
jgi:hypothetical protein